MRVLLVLTVPPPRLEAVLSELRSRGHDVHVAVDSEFTDTQAMDRVLHRHPEITCGVVPKRDDEWVALAESVGRSIEYLRFRSPLYAQAPKLRARAQRRAPAPVLRVADWPLVRSRIGVRGLSAALRRLESAIPPSPQIVQLLRDWPPDLVIVASMVKGTAHPGQGDYVRAARGMGIRSALMVRSWDNLTTKGLIREPPDRVYVWNDHQRREASELHGVPVDRVVATGAFGWDDWFDRRPSTTAQEFRDRLGLAGQRPMLLYVCSSRFIAPDEPRFVERWLTALREQPDERLRGASVLVRPHPEAREVWRGSRLADAADVAIWPRQRDDPDGYFDSIHHSAAVVGLNTSALIEAAILPRPTFTVLDPQYRATQEGTLHFHYLPRHNGGPLITARSFSEHFEQLAQALSEPARPDPMSLDFVRRFVRPHGLERPALPILVEGLEAQLRSSPPRVEPGRSRRAVTAALRPVARLAGRSARRRAADPPGRGRRARGRAAAGTRRAGGRTDGTG